jgi:hypothetical protein
MRHWMRSRRFALVTAGTLAVLAAAAQQSAEAHPRGRRYVVVRPGYYGYSPWWGFGFGLAPYWGAWGPYYPGFYPPGGVDLNAAMVAGYGGIDLNVKPNRADVWVDGKYVGEARDLDGSPTYLWLAEGAHRIAVHKGGYLVFDEPVEVRRGMLTELKVRLQPGDSPTPGTKPAPPGDGKDKKKEKDEDKPQA